ncbi:MAG: GNAT family N-acetyltransferase [Sciscionella sp.]
MSPGAGVVRTADRLDLFAVARIYAYYVSDTVVTFEVTPPDLGTWYQRFDRITTRGLPFLVAEDTGGIVGYAYATPWHERAGYAHTVESSVYVAHSAHGNGFGRALLEALLLRCSKAGIRQVIAVIADSGDPASTALHRRCGFTEAGRLVGVGAKHGRWLDTVLWQRGLADD